MAEHDSDRDETRRSRSRSREREGEGGEGGGSNGVKSEGRERSSSPSKSTQAVGKNNTVVRLRGLPWQTTDDDIIDFFMGQDIQKDGIYFLLNAQGRASGEAFVNFVYPSSVEKALEKHKSSMGSRYIEVYPSTKREMEFAREAPERMGMRTSSSYHSRDQGSSSGPNCFNCHQPGHFARDCPRGDNRGSSRGGHDRPGGGGRDYDRGGAGGGGGGGGGGGACYRCGQPGHFARECPNSAGGGDYRGGGGDRDYRSGGGGSGAAGGGGGGGCYRCGQPGHFARECPNGTGTAAVAASAAAAAAAAAAGQGAYGAPYAGAYGQPAYGAAAMYPAASYGGYPAAGAYGGGRGAYPPGYGAYGSSYPYATGGAGAAPYGRRF